MSACTIWWKFASTFDTELGIISLFPKRLEFLEKPIMKIDTNNACRWDRKYTEEVYCNLFQTKEKPVWEGVCLIFLWKILR